MSSDTLNLLLKKMINPRSSVASFHACMNTLAKTGEDDAVTFFKALCDFDISKAVPVGIRLQGDLATRCQAAVYDTIHRHCQDAESFSHKTLEAILELNHPSLFHTAVPLLTQEILAQTFAACSCQNACRLAQWNLRFVEKPLRVQCMIEFCEFLNRYESSGEAELSELLPVLLEHNALIPFSKLLDTLGYEKLEALYGADLFRELDRLLVSGFNTPEMWDAYFFCLFRQEHTPEELLEKGLWYLQLHCNDDILDQVGANFYLHAAERLDVEHELFNHADCFEDPSAFSRKHTLRYQDVLEPLWEYPAQLSYFLDRTALCNPFRNEVLQDDRFVLIRDSQNNRDYDRLSYLFERWTDCDTILKLFFQTNLKNSLPMEDLLYLSLRHGVLDEMLESLKAMPFSGKVTKHTTGHAVVSPMRYYVMSLHSVRIPYYTQAGIQSVTQDLKGQTLEYIITGFYSGQISTKLFTEADKPAEMTLQHKTWPEAVEHMLRTLPTVTRVEGFIKKKPFPILDFGLNSLLEENDFDLVTEQLLQNPQYMERYTALFRYAQWNSSFVAQDLMLPSHFYKGLSKYQPKAMDLFRHLFAYPDLLEPALELYFTSIYKAIIPLNKLLELGDLPALLEVLPKREIYIRLRETGSHLCRPANIACGPVCEIQGAPGFNTHQTFPAVITDVLTIDDNVYRIRLTYRSNDGLTVEQRGSLFGYLARNEHIGRKKREQLLMLPPVSTYDFREMVFNLQCTEEAFILRRADGEALKKLFYALGKRNPFYFQISHQADINYLGRLYSEEQQKTVVSATETMILNAADIETIQWIWSSTSAKYYISLPNLAQMIRQRRPELTGQISTIFDGMEFQCSADANGYLWHYAIPYGSVFVGKDFAGQALKCAITLEDGDVRARVISVEDGTDALHVFALCLMLDWPYTDAVKPYLATILKQREMLTDDQKIRELLSNRTLFLRLILRSANNLDLSLQKGMALFARASEQMQKLHDALHGEEPPVQSLGSKVSRIIKNSFSSIPLEDMEAMIARLTDEYMQLFPDPEAVLPCLRSIFSDYAYYYGDNGIVHIWIGQLRTHLSAEVADAFEADIKKNKRYQRNI